MPRKTDLKIILGQRIKFLRTSYPMTQEMLGKKLGVKKSTIANYESGYSEPENEKMCKIANIFDVSVDYLLGNTDIKNPYNFLIDELLKLHLTVEELEESYNNVLNYYSLEKYPFSPFDNSKNEKVTSATLAIFNVASSFFNSKLDKLLGNNFEILANINDKDLKLFNEAKSYAIEQITKIYKNVISIFKSKYLYLTEEDINFISHIKKLDETNKMIIKNTMEALLDKQEKNEKKEDTK